jgi:hypothetical protein
MGTKPIILGTATVVIGLTRLTQAVESPILNKLTSQDLEKRWAKYDAFSLDDLSQNRNHPGDLLYSRGDVIEVVDNTNIGLSDTAEDG